MSAKDKATVKIFRFDPAVDKEPRYETYSIPAEAWENRKVIDVIRYIYENFAPGLSFREPCHREVCGACTVRINHKPSLACEAMAEKEMLIEPTAKDRVLKDLVVKVP